MSEENQIHEIRSEHSRVVVASHGGVVMRWVIDGEDGEYDVLDGYRDAAELHHGDGSRHSLLAPWSNRIRQARYSWNGRDFDLGPDNNGVREALHGLVENAEFSVDDIAVSGDSIRLSTVVDDDNYPHPVRVSVEYHVGSGVDGEALRMRLECTNLGDQPTPIGLGWHPYVRYDGGRDGATLTIKARTRVVTDEALIPLPADAAFTAIDSYDLDTSTATIDLTEALDTAYTDLTVCPGERPTVMASVNHPSGARTTITAAVSQAPARGVGIWHVFTGEALESRQGESVAVEFCQFMTDAFNRAECQPFLAVAPGSSRVMEQIITHHPAAHA